MVELLLNTFREQLSNYVSAPTEEMSSSACYVYPLLERNEYRLCESIEDFKNIIGLSVIHTG